MAVSDGVVQVHCKIARMRRERACLESAARAEATKQTFRKHVHEYSGAFQLSLTTNSGKATFASVCFDVHLTRTWPGGVSSGWVFRSTEHGLIGICGEAVLCAQCVIPFGLHAQDYLVISRICHRHVETESPRPVADS